MKFLPLYKKVRSIYKSKVILHISFILDSILIEIQAHSTTIFKATFNRQFFFVPVVYTDLYRDIKARMSVNKFRYSQTVLYNVTRGAINIEK